MVTRCLLQSYECLLIDRFFSIRYPPVNKPNATPIVNNTIKNITKTRIPSAIGIVFSNNFGYCRLGGGVIWFSDIYIRILSSASLSVSKYNHRESDCKVRFIQIFLNPRLENCLFYQSANYCTISQSEYF